MAIKLEKVVYELIKNIFLTSVVAFLIMLQAFEVLGYIDRNTMIVLAVGALVYLMILYVLTQIYDSLKVV